MTALGAPRAATQPQTLADVLANALARPSVSPLIRDGAGRLAFGETVQEALRTCLGSSLGPMRGRTSCHELHRGR